MKISEGPNARLGTLPGPPLRIRKTEFEKKRFFSKNAETTIFISSRAFRVKRQWCQNHVFHVLDPPGALRGPNPFSRDPPRASRSAPWSSRGGPKSSQEGPGASKGQIKFTKSACSNPRKYVYLASRDLKKTLSDHFSRLRVPPRDPPVWRPYSSRSAPGPQKGPRELPGPLRAPPGPPRAPLKI